MVNSLRKVDFSHHTGHYTGKKIRPPPLEKILGAPLLYPIPPGPALPFRSCPVLPTISGLSQPRPAMTDPS